MNILNNTQHAVLLIIRNGKPVVIAPQNDVAAEQALNSINIEEEALGCMVLIPAGGRYGTSDKAINASSIICGTNFNAFINKIRARNHVRHTVINAVANTITRPLSVRLQDFKASKTAANWDFDCEADLSFDQAGFDLDQKLRVIINSKSLFSYPV